MSLAGERCFDCKHPWVSVVRPADAMLDYIEQMSPIVIRDVHRWAGGDDKWLMRFCRIAG